MFEILSPQTHALHLIVSSTIASLDTMSKVPVFICINTDSV